MSSPYLETYFQTPADIEASIKPDDATKTQWKEDPSGRNMFGTYEVAGRTIDPLPHRLTARDMKEAYVAAAQAFRKALGIAVDASKEDAEEAYGNLDEQIAGQAREVALQARQSALQAILDRRRAARSATAMQEPERGVAAL